MASFFGIFLSTEELLRRSVRYLQCLAGIWVGTVSPGGEGVAVEELELLSPSAPRLADTLTARTRFWLQLTRMCRQVCLGVGVPTASPHVAGIKSSRAAWKRRESDAKCRNFYSARIRIIVNLVRSIRLPIVWSNGDICLTPAYGTTSAIPALFEYLPVGESAPGAVL